MLVGDGIGDSSTQEAKVPGLMLRKPLVHTGYTRLHSNMGQLTQHEQLRALGNSDTESAPGMSLETR